MKLIWNYKSTNICLATTFSTKKKVFSANNSPEGTLNPTQRFGDTHYPQKYPLDHDFQKYIAWILDFSTKSKIWWIASTKLCNIWQQLKQQSVQYECVMSIPMNTFTASERYHVPSALWLSLEMTYLFWNSSHARIVVPFLFWCSFLHTAGHQTVNVDI